MDDGGEDLTDRELLENGGTRDRLGSTDHVDGGALGSQGSEGMASPGKYAAQASLELTSVNKDALLKLAGRTWVFILADTVMFSVVTYKFSV